MKLLYWTGVFALLGAGMWATTPGAPSRLDGYRASRTQAPETVIDLEICDTIAAGEICLDTAVWDPSDTSYWDDSTLVEEVVVPEEEVGESIYVEDYDPDMDIKVWDPVEKALRDKCAGRTFSSVDSRGCRLNFEIDEFGSDLTVVSGHANGSPILVIPDSAYAFDLAFGVINVGPEAFYTCKESADDPMRGVKTLILGSNLTEVGSNSFANAPDLESVEVNQPLRKIRDGAFRGCKKLKNVDFPEICFIDTIGDNAFADCISLKSFHISADLNELSDSSFAGCSALDSLTVADGNIAFDLTDNVLYSWDDTELLFYPEGKKDRSYQVRYGTKIINPYAFAGNRSLESVSLPASTKVIGMDCFKGCTALKEVTFSGPVDNIGPGAFAECGGLKEMTLYRPTLYCRNIPGKADAFPAKVKIKLHDHVVWDVPAGLKSDPLKAVFDYIGGKPYFTTQDLPAGTGFDESLGNVRYAGFTYDHARPEILAALEAIPENYLHYTYADGTIDRGRLYIDRKRGSALVYYSSYLADNLFYFDHPDLKEIVKVFGSD